MSKENIINKMTKLSSPWADIGTILGQTSISDYMFYLKKFKANLKSALPQKKSGNVN